MYATTTDGAPQQAARQALAGTGRTAGDLPTYLTDQVCAEAGIWAPDAAARALRQSRGDLVAAVGMLRVWAATLPHDLPVDLGDDDLRVVRRISSAFAEVPGGQWLGLAPELAGRVLDWDDPAPTAVATPEDSPGPPIHDESASEPDGVPVVGRLGRVRDLLAGANLNTGADDAPVCGLDPASTALSPDPDRPSRQAVLAGAEGAPLTAVAAAVMNGRREAILTELLVCHARVRLPHPRTGVGAEIGSVPCVTAEVALDALVDGTPGLVLGWGTTLGGNERRALSAALVDGALNDQADPPTVRLDTATVLTLTNASANNGFVDHLKLPHHASFASYLQRATPPNPDGSTQ